MVANNKPSRDGGIPAGKEDDMRRTTYIVEKDCKPVMKFKNQVDALAYADEIGGVAWEHTVWTDRSGIPCNSYRRYDTGECIWRYQ